jgi:hypothetical protein
MRLVDDTVYNEAVKFVAAMQDDPEHPARHAVDGYLARLAGNLQHDPTTIARLEEAKSAVFDSPRARARRRGLEHGEDGPAEEPGRPRQRAAPTRERRARRDRRAAVDGCRAPAPGGRSHRGCRGVPRRSLPPRHRLDHHRHRREVGPAETTEKIELMVGRDLQYIRLNGTIVGALAGLVIFAVAHAVLV